LGVKSAVVGKAKKNEGYLYGNDRRVAYCYMIKRRNEGQAFTTMVSSRSQGNNTDAVRPVKALKSDGTK
jgi:hypothetical protein